MIVLPSRVRNTGSGLADGQGDRGRLCRVRGLHPHPPRAHRGQLVCLILQGGTLVFAPNCADGHCDRKRRPTGFFFQNRLWRNEVAHKRLLRAQEQTRKVKEILRLANTYMYPGPEFRYRSLHSLPASPVQFQAPEYGRRPPPPF